MNPAVKNLFDDIAASSDREVFRALFKADQVRVEQIVSHGQHSPYGFWYDQPEDEWVLLLQGTAVLQYGDQTRVSLKAGDSLLIPRHLKHRVEQTSGDAVWLALHSAQITPAA